MSFVLQRGCRAKGLPGFQRRLRGSRVPLVAAIMALLVAVATPGIAPSRHLALPDIEAACETDNPYLVAACYPQAQQVVDYSYPSIVLIRDRPGDANPYLVADQRQLGAVWGLGYAPTGTLYAAAFHKRSVPFGPGGPGAIYAVDLQTGAVSLFAVVPNAGDDNHNRDTKDRLGRKWAGKTSLGDLEVSPAGDELYVVNLYDRRIYRYAVPSGVLLSSFDHGASAESWAADARPFGLSVSEGILYHGLVSSGERTRERLKGFVYASLPDGSSMRLVGEFPLDYPRGQVMIPGQTWRESSSLAWHSWRDQPRLQGPGMMLVYPMPILADIVIDADRDMVVGLRDRLGDVTLAIAHYGHPSSLDDPVGLAIGDIVRGSPTDDGWEFDAAREHFRDNIKDSSESALGGIAAFPPKDYLIGAVLGQVAGNVFRPIPDQGVVWWDTTSGDKLRHEGLCVHGGRLVRPWDRVDSLALISGVREASAHNEGQAPGNAGDVEVLCVSEGVPSATPSRTATPSATPEPPTPTPTSTDEPSPTSTSPPPPTPAATTVPAPILLPLVLREHCDPEYQRADIALVIDTSSSMQGAKIEDARAAALSFVGVIDLSPGRSQVTVIRYDREAEVVRELTRARSSLESAIRSLHVRSGTHIDKGLRAALAELQSPRHLESNKQVMVLLTDGVQTGTPGEELKATGEVREAGIRLYVIGLGADADEAALKAMAGSNERYFFAPDSTDLAQIYGEIAADLLCPGTDLWSRR